MKKRKNLCSLVVNSKIKYTEPMGQKIAFAKQLHNLCFLFRLPVELQSNGNLHL